jgi:hypothetical protein
MLYFYVISEFCIGQFILFHFSISNGHMVMRELTCRMQRIMHCHLLMMRLLKGAPGINEGMLAQLLLSVT